MARSKGDAEAAKAERSEAFTKADSAAKDAGTRLQQGDYAEATRGFLEARDGYDRARRAAKAPTPAASGAPPANGTATSTAPVFGHARARDGAGHDRALRARPPLRDRQDPDRRRAIGRRGAGLRHRRREDPKDARLRGSRRVRGRAGDGQGRRSRGPARLRGQRGQEASPGPERGPHPHPERQAGLPAREPAGPRRGPAATGRGRRSQDGLGRWRQRLEPRRGGDVRPGRDRHLPGSPGNRLGLQWAGRPE